VTTARERERERERERLRGVIAWSRCVASHWPSTRHRRLHLSDESTSSPCLSAEPLQHTHTHRQTDRRTMSVVNIGEYIGLAQVHAASLLHSYIVDRRKSQYNFYYKRADNATWLRSVTTRQPTTTYSKISSCTFSAGHQSNENWLIHDLVQPVNYYYCLRRRCRPRYSLKMFLLIPPCRE